jgi:hypothetical protein
MRSGGKRKMVFQNELARVWYVSTALEQRIHKIM